MSDDRSTLLDALAAAVRDYRAAIPGPFPEWYAAEQRMLEIVAALDALERGEHDSSN